jgi:hypothetical protein
MSVSEKFALKWNAFKDNITLAFSNLRDDNRFTDVTLITEDGQHLEAHKVVLSASSPFFMNILKINKHPNPLIYLKGFKANDLVSILDFMYHGVADVYQDNLDKFLAVAEELQLKGLTAGAEKKDESEEEIKNGPIPMKTEIFAPIPENDYGSRNASIDQTKIIATTIQSANVTFTGGSSEELKETLWSMISQAGTVLTCTVCGKSKDKALDSQAKRHMVSHVESLHIEGVSYECTKCDKSFR